MDPAPIAPIRLSVRTAASPATAWAAVTEPDRIAAWFTDASELGGVGDPYRLDFGEGSVVEGVVTALEPGRGFSHTWTWAGPDAAPPGPTLVSWSVRPLEGGGAEVELLHDGWSEAGADDAIRDDHEAYWSGYLDDLLVLLEDETAR